MFAGPEAALQVAGRRQRRRQYGAAMAAVETGNTGEEV